MADTTVAGPTPRPYPKIPSRVRLGESGAGVREWIALEKVHGAHFAVVCDPAGGVRPAKRRGPLGGAALDGFFGVSRIWPALSVAAARFAGTLPGAAVVTLYGELAGGHYPHPAVPAVPGAEPVQTGVWYAPDPRWLLFDATADGHWLADRALRDAAAVAGLSCVPALAHGPLSRLQDLPPVFPTRVPALFGLPELPGNLAEGYVLRPAGSWPESRERPVAKVKHPSFAEDARYDGSRPYLPPPEGASGIPAWLLLQATTLLTPARAAAAVSKLGPRTAVETVAEEITRDVTDELADALGGLDAPLAHGLERALRPGARALAAFDSEDRRTLRSGRRS